MASQDRFPPLASGMWPTLFMSTVIHAEHGSSAIWRRLGPKWTEAESVLAASDSSPDDAQLLATLEPYELEEAGEESRHARLRLWVIPPSPERSRPERPSGDLDIGTLLRAVRSDTADRQPYFDCLATCLFPPAEFQPRIPLPLNIWESLGPTFSHMVGARFSLRHRGLSDAWLAVDLVENPKVIRVQVHFEKRLSVTTAATRAWALVHTYMTQGTLRRGT